MTFPLILNICVEEEMKPKLSEEAILDWTKNLKMGAGKSITYQVKFVVDSNFGMPGPSRSATERRASSIWIASTSKVQLILPATPGFNQSTLTLQIESSSLPR